MNRFSRNIISIATLAFAATAAHAINLFDAVRLPDDGNGSKATAGFMDYVDDDCMIVGQKMKPSGSVVPMAWLVDNNSNSVMAMELPLPPGFQGGCNGAGDFADGSVAVVGTISNANGKWGVVWRKPMFGNWQMPTVLCQDSDESYVNSAERCNDGSSFLMVTGSVLEGGRWIPTLHRVTSDAVETIDLPIPQTMQGAALGVDMADSTGDHSVACGWATFPNGVMKPVRWTETNGNWIPKAIQVQQGVEGLANSVITFPENHADNFIGTLTKNGRSRGFIMDDSDGSESITLIAPLGGFSDSSGTAAYNLGDTATHEVGHWMGISSNPGGARVSMLVYSGESGGLNEVMARQMLADPLSVGNIVAMDPLTKFADLVGQVRDGSNPPQAALFRTTNTVVPDAVSLLAGRYGDGKLAGLWHNDGDVLRIRTEQVGGQKIAVANLTFCVCPTSEQNTEIHFIGRAGSNQPGASGALAIFSYDHDLGEWVQVGSHSVSDSNQSFTNTLPGSPSRWIDPVTHDIHVRLRFIQNGNHPTFFDTEMLQLDFH